MTRIRSWSARAFALGVAALCAAAPAQAQDVRFPPAPNVDARQFVVDQAGMLSAEDKARVDRLATDLLREHATPILVVTVPSLASYGAQGYSIERYACAAGSRPKGCAPASRRPANCWPSGCRSSRATRTNCPTSSC